MRAFELINHRDRTWDEGALLVLFPRSDIINIMAIPLSEFPGDDRVVWKHFEDGAYSVKSGYHVAVKKLQMRHPLVPFWGGFGRIFGM